MTAASSQRKLIGTLWNCVISKCWPILWPRHLSTIRCGVSASSKNVLSISGFDFSLDICTTKSVTPPHSCSRVSACLAEALVKAGETREVASVKHVKLAPITTWRLHAVNALVFFYKIMILHSYTVIYYRVQQ